MNAYKNKQQVNNQVSRKASCRTRPLRTSS